MADELATKPALEPAVHPGPSARELTFARWALVGVGACYVIAQLLLFSYHRAPGWDESVYLSQVMRGTKAVSFAAYRARGISLLVAPAARIGTIGAVRLSLVVILTALMMAVFWLWIPVIGAAAPLAAGLLSFSWMGLISGSEVYPNLTAALLGVGSAALVVRYTGPGERGSRSGWLLVSLAVMLALMAVFRPTEATFMAIALGIYLLVSRTASRRVVGAIAIGLIAGWLPWLVEMSTRFQGPLNALKLAGNAHFAVVSFGQNMTRYLGYTNGQGAESTYQHIPVAGVLWWAWLLTLTIVAFVRARDRRNVVVICSISALAFAVEYVALVSALAARYLLPAYAFISIPAAVGVVALFRGTLRLRVVGTVAVACVIPWAVWQGVAAHRTAVYQEVSYSYPQTIGNQIRRISAGGPCAVLSLRWYPEIAVASGCSGDALASSKMTAAQLDQLSKEGRSVFLVVDEQPKPPAPLGTFTPVRSFDLGRNQWFVYQFPEPAPSGGN